MLIKITQETKTVSYVYILASMQLFLHKDNSKKYMYMYLNILKLYFKL